MLLGALVFYAAWWITAAAADWHAVHAGQIDAWIIARSGHSETGVLHQVVVGVIWFLRWGLGLTLALSLAATITAGGFGALVRAGWMTRALHPKRWAPVCLLVGLLVQVPWEYVYWRPLKLGLAAEPWFVTLKLGVMVVLWAVAGALAIRVVTPGVVARAAAPSGPPSGTTPPPTPPRAA